MGGHHVVLNIATGGGKSLPQMAANAFDLGICEHILSYLINIRSWQILKEAVTDPTSSSKVDVSRGGLMFGNKNGQQNCILYA